MPIHPQSEQLAAHLIRDEAVRADDAVFVADLVCDRLRWPEGGGAPVVLGTDGQPAPGLTVADVIASVRQTLPGAFAGGPVKAKIAPNTLTAKAVAERDARLAGAKVEPNPFHPATRNLTKATLIERDDPARAAQLRAQAGLN